MPVAASEPTDSRAALLGIATPLNGIGLTSTESSILVVVSAQLGTLAADPAAGVTVRGGGSSVLWLSGPVAAVNARLATLSYTGQAAGTDEIAITAIDSAGPSTTTRLPLVVAPLTGSAGLAGTVQVENGTLMISNRTVDGVTIGLQQNARTISAPTCVLIDTVLGAGTTLSLDNAAPSATLSPRLAIGGQVELDGALNLSGAGTVVSLAQGATLHNLGRIAIDGAAAHFTGAGQLLNYGTVLLVGDGTGAAVSIDTAICGSGTIALEDGASLSLAAGLGDGETVLLGDGANTLSLLQPGTFAGSIAGFDTADTIALNAATVTGAITSRSAEGNTATVTLLNGASVAGSLHFTGVGVGTVFRLATDAAGGETLRLVAAPIAPTAAPKSLDVFRFFDAAHGTQLLTDDPAERDAITATRPDLRFEGVGLHALAAPDSDPAAAPVFRFFDTATGTHLLTASMAERDSLLATRHDLVFEPGSTLYEHTTLQAGDVPVFRFFDNGTGAHFLTADPLERAAILNTRPDMTLEGIAFYAPKV